MKKTNEAVLLALWNAKKSDLQISQMAGCSVATVCRWRQRNGLQSHPERSRMTDEQKQTATRLAVEGKTIQEIAEETGVFLETARKFLVRNGVQYEKSTRRTIAKEVHGTIGYGGYVEILVDLDGPYGHLAFRRGGRRGYAPLHRMRMEDKLGRRLKGGEVVHHIDGDVYNNSPSNLEVFSSTAEHRRHHEETGIRRCKVAERL